ncbi:MAG: hypothetical protein IKQ25_03060 [Lachnospiraceae bacterium]|nr:hypothetical protein [Lachnospiraceae bacterium]
MNKETKEATNTMAKEKASMTADKTEQAQTDKQNGNREVVSDVFSMLMQYPEYALDIYNALNGSHYEDPRLVEIVTLKNGISLTVRNDGSFFIGGVVNFYEHQSTHNPNMPLRFTIYYLEYLKQWIKDYKVYLYSKKRIRIPTPHFLVFYNGTVNRPDYEVVKLSASFCSSGQDSEEAIEVRCKVYNINYGCNSWLAESSRVIDGYGIFINKIRNDIDKGMELKEAIDNAINDCIKANILREFFIERRDEVRRVTELDFTWESQEELNRIEHKADAVCELLEDLGEIPQELQDEIYAERDLEVLSKMHKLAAKAKSIEEFQAKLEEMKCCL